MDLMTLAAKLTLDDKSFQSGIKDAESAGEKLAGKMSAMTVAVGNIAADLIKQGFNAVKNMIGGAVDAYADYQQLIGGVETLFKESSDKVAAYAKQSFKTTGLSANQYMETVTSFSASLLQGLKGDTDAAAELSNMAITDMADNANKMGTDISSIQTAYQGFAKQNYTMLDNLKLGYGGTKEEMVRLINDSGILDKKIKNLDNITFDQIIEAIHAIQTEMGITGTTAQEAADTISGSKASLKAAWEDLMSAIGGEGGEGRLGETLENFKQAFSTYMDNYIPTLQATILNIGDLVNGVADAVKNLPTDLISNLFQSGLASGTEMISGVSNIVNWLIDSMATAIQDAAIDPSRVEAFGYALGNFLGTTVSNILTHLPNVVESMVQVGISLAGSIVSGIWDGLFGAGNEVDKIKTELSNTLTEIDLQTTKSGAILDYMEQLVVKYGQAARDTEEWKNAEEELESILGGSSEVFNAYDGNIQGAIDKLREMNEELRKTAVMNALQKASAEEMELLTAQTLEYNKAKGTYDLNASSQQTYLGNVVADIMQYAAERAADYYESHHDEQGNITGDVNYYQELQNLAKGLADAGGELIEISELDFTGLKGIVDYIADDSLSKSFETEKLLYEQAEAEMLSAKSRMEEAQKQIEATEKVIDETEAAMDQTVKDLLGSGKEAGNSIEMGGNFVQEALTNVAGAISTLSQKIAAVQFAQNPFASFLGGLFAPKAVGIDYVPYDGFRAELHKGEAVITKEENERRGSRMDYGALEASLEDAIERSMARMNINMNGERVGDITTKRVAQNIVNSERAYARAMGG